MLMFLYLKFKKILCVIFICWKEVGIWIVYLVLEIIGRLGRDYFKKLIVFLVFWKFCFLELYVEYGEENLLVLVLEFFNLDFFWEENF